MTPAPYWTDGTVTLYVGDCREVLPKLGVTADLVLADPPYGETSLAWDRWPDGWLDTVAGVTSSLWCFGSMRMFLQQRDQFEAARWRLSQDIIWEKTTGTIFAADRFSRVHEYALHWYRGNWRELFHEPPRVVTGVTHRSEMRRGADRTVHSGSIGAGTWTDDGTRLERSVIRVRNMHGRSLHPTEKPIGILDPLIRYACPPGGLVIDPFAGSGSTLDAARASGRRAIGIEANEAYAEKAKRRLSQMTLEAS